MNYYKLLSSFFDNKEIFTNFWIFAPKIEMNPQTALYVYYHGNEVRKDFM